MTPSNFSRCSLYKACLAGIFLTSIVFLPSCRISKVNVYFKNLQKDTAINRLVSKDYESKIQVGDQLSIMAASMSPQEDIQFNNASAVSSSPAMSGFTVYDDGTVLLHRLGSVKAAGLTRKELGDKLQVDLLPYMKDPIVNVNYLNHKVTVLGYVGEPQVMQMPEEEMTLIDVLVKSGDIEKDGLLNQVMVIRDSSNKKVVKFLNLEDNSIFTSTWYYVKPDDIIIVRPNEKKIREDERTRKFSSNVSLIASVLALFVTILALVTN